MKDDKLKRTYVLAINNVVEGVYPSIRKICKDRGWSYNTLSRKKFDTNKIIFMNDQRVIEIYKCDLK